MSHGFLYASRAIAWIVAAACVALLLGCDRSPPEDGGNAADFVDDNIGSDDVNVEIERELKAAEVARFQEAFRGEVNRLASSSLTKAVDYLMLQQSDDGAWRSTTYGPLKQGPALTSLALYALSHAPRELVEPHRAKLQAAYDFLRPGLEKKGQIAAPDGTLDYPTYDAALVLIAARRLKLDVPDDDLRKLEQWLLDMQLTEKHGVPPDSIHYGGWDLEAAQGASGEQLKGSNMALTTLCLEALSESMNADAAAAVKRAAHWVLGAQNADGGFVFHTWRPHPGNKAMWEDEAQMKAISYGTATCDGLRALTYGGLSGNQDPTLRAAEWLTKHRDVEFVPGFETKAKEAGWRDDLRYYYYYTQAKVLPLLDETEAPRRREELKRILIQAQQPDGSYKNEQPRMFEDDPLLATSLAIVALSEAIQ